MFLVCTFLSIFYSSLALKSLMILGAIVMFCFSHFPNLSDFCFLVVMIRFWGKSCHLS